MLRTVITLYMLLLLTSVASAEVYKWEDENGMHFTDSPGSVPEKYREKVYEETREQIKNATPQARVAIPQQISPVITQYNQAAIYQANLEQQRRVSAAFDQQQASALASNTKNVEGKQKREHGMILGPLVNQIIGTLWYLLAIVFLAALLKSPSFKGVIGEFIVNITSKIMLDKNVYHLIKNVTLPTEDGTTQIDHVFVSKYGVFVVETKNMKGWIFGGTNQSTWTQKIFKHTNKFQNPLNQNYKHMKTLESLLGLSDQQIHSVIVFVGDSTFKTEMPANVTHGIGYIRYIKSKTNSVLSPTEVKEIVSKIEMGRLTPSFKTDREHVNHVKTIVSNKQSSTGCPKCGSPMVIRESNKGPSKSNKFLGCSRYPQCRGILSVA